MKFRVIQSAGKMIVAFALLLAGLQGQAQDYAGSWKGNGIQIDDPTPWSIHLTIQGNKGTVVFPTLGCKATISFLKKEKGYSVFSEIITSGADKCLSGLKIKLALLEDEKGIMNLFEIDDEGRMISYATLSKE